jgi:hypothetical protein
MYYGKIAFQLILGRFWDLLRIPKTCTGNKLIGVLGGCAGTGGVLLAAPFIFSVFFVFSFDAFDLFLQCCFFPFAFSFSPIKIHLKIIFLLMSSSSFFYSKIQESQHI